MRPILIMFIDGFEAKKVWTTGWWREARQEESKHTVMWVCRNYKSVLKWPYVMWVCRNYKSLAIIALAPPDPSKQIFYLIYYQYRIKIDRIHLKIKANIAWVKGSLNSYQRNTIKQREKNEEKEELFIWCFVDGEVILKKQETEQIFASTSIRTCHFMDYPSRMWSFQSSFLSNYQATRGR